MHGLAGAAQIKNLVAHAAGLGLVGHLLSPLIPGRGRERAAVVFVVAAARLRAHRPEHDADDEARDRRGANSGEEVAARPRPPQAPGRLDGLGVLDLDQFVVLGRRRAGGRRLLHGFGFLPCKGCPARLGLPPVCVTHETLQTASGQPCCPGVQSDLIQIAAALQPSISRQIAALNILKRGGTYPSKARAGTPLDLCEGALLAC